MLATHRVKDSNSKTIGFLLEDGSFYTDYFVAQNVELLDNLKPISNGVIESEFELPIVFYKELVKEKYNQLNSQNPFVRDIQEELLQWKNNPLHKVLQLDGSRQIGKTTELLKFAYENYEYVIYVNLSVDTYQFIETVIRQGVYPLILEGYCRNANLPHYANGKNTLLILDEIQTSAEAYNAIRTIHGNLNCDLIVTGSYLGQTLKKEFFQPAGTVSYLRMFPLSFREFCRIFNEEQLLDGIDLYGGSSEEDYKNLYQLYDIYRQIGGYPEVIKAYTQSKDSGACENIIENLLETFEKESRNYFSESKESLIFRMVYTEAIREMCSEKKGSGSKVVEIVTKLVKDSQKVMVSRDEVSRAIQWLIYSGIIGECNLCNNGDVNDIIPARRMYYMDCGIASHIAHQTGIPDSDIEGFLAENFVYSELYRLYANRFEKKQVKGKVPCFSIYNNYELDFVVLDKNNVIYGIEVKTDTGNPKSLKVFIDKKLVDKGIVAKKTIGGHGDKFDTIPIYAVGARFPYR